MGNISNSTAGLILGSTSLFLKGNLRMIVGIAAFAISFNIGGIAGTLGFETTGSGS